MSFVSVLVVDFDPLAQFCTHARTQKSQVESCLTYCGTAFLTTLFAFVFFFIQAARPKTAWAQVSLSSHNITISVVALKLLFFINSTIQQTAK